MALDITAQQSSRRPVGFSVLGVFLLLFSGLVFYDNEQQKADAIYVPTAYEYTVRQSVESDVVYAQNSFFPNGPGKANQAYVMELTDKIKANFHYTLTTTATADMTYTYDVTAKTQGTYSAKSDDEGAPQVWSKTDQIISPVTRSVSATEIVINPVVDIPYATYKNSIDQFKTALTVPITSEMVVTLTVNVTGVANGTEFTDSKVTTITAPLDQQIYMLAVKYDKDDKKQVVDQEGQNNKTAWQRYQSIFAVVLAALGIMLLVYGLRRQIFKSQYQRELERIYRYNEGIIIRASKPADFDGKHVVPVLSFEDMINLEEELKMPIVAFPTGSDATRFSIIRDDVAYVYTLGKVLLEDEIPVDTDEPTHRTRQRKKS